MPELPEAETIVRNLRPRLLNRKIISIEFPRARYFRPQLEQSIEHYCDSRIVDIFRHGKAVIFQLRRDDGEDDFIVVRLGMTGQLLLSHEPDRHTHAIFCFDPPGAHLCFRDHRQFGMMFFLKDWRSIYHPIKIRPALSASRKSHAAQRSKARNHQAELQPIADPLKIPVDDFVEIFWKRQGTIKAALMSQKLIVGVGNIYADESLFAARLHPRQKIYRLSRQRLQKYFNSLVKILNKAIELGGSSISDFVNPSNSQGEFQVAHRVYGRTGEKCLRHGCGGIIRRSVIASRSTHYCPRCQRQI